MRYAAQTNCKAELPTALTEVQMPKNIPLSENEPLALTWWSEALEKTDFNFDFENLS